ncbi:hypothetical protein ACFL0Q_01760 [Thermodesulfobacteriota bacterium]
MVFLIISDVRPPILKERSSFQAIADFSFKGTHLSSAPGFFVVGTHRREVLDFVS